MDALADPLGAGWPGHGLPVSSDLFRLLSRGGGTPRRVARELAGIETAWALSALGRAGGRPGAGAAGHASARARLSPANSAGRLSLWIAKPGLPFPLCVARIDRVADLYPAASAAAAGASRGFADADVPRARAECGGHRDGVARSLAGSRSLTNPRRRRRRRRFVEKTASLQNGDLQLRLTNRGGGIAEAVLPKHKAENGQPLRLERGATGCRLARSWKNRPTRSSRNSRSCRAQAGQRAVRARAAEAA